MSNNDAEVCSSIEFSDKNFFVRTILNIDFSNNGNCTVDPSPPIYSTEVVALYACNSIVPFSVTNSTNGADVQSWDQSCSEIAGRSQVRFNYYTDAQCTSLKYYETDTSFFDNLQYCQAVSDPDLPGTVFFSNTYCVNDGNYQQYNPSGSYLTTTTYGGDVCSGSVVYDGTESINTCFQLTGTNKTNFMLKDSDYEGYYTYYQYASPDCSGTGTQIKDYIPTGSDGLCSPAFPSCPEGNLQFYNPKSYFNGLAIQSAGDNDDDNRVGYGIGFGLGFGIPLLIVLGVIYHFYYSKNAKQNLQKLRQGTNSSA